MTTRRFAFILALAAPLFGQVGLDPAKLLEQPTDTWPTYHGDYSGRRFSTLKQINSSNVRTMTLAWMYHASGNPGSIKATPLEINGILYFAAPDHVWAVDARNGREIWTFKWTSKGGTHIGNRGVAVFHDWLYVETPDCHLVSLNIKDGSQRWAVPICDLDQFYYGSLAPTVVHDVLITGVSGDDLDRPGYVSGYNLETGAMKWRFYTVPQKKGDPGSETWPNEEMMKHGGGMTWQPPTYDPALNLLYITTGNPQPVIAHKNREGANLFTACVVALNPDTGKMQWYFQASPHDTHDWDATQVPVLFDADWEGQPRKMLALAARNGYFFVLDRATGKNLLSTPYVKVNWAKGVDKNGSPIPDPAKMPQLDGSLVSPNQGGATNWPPPTFSPQTGLFYVNASRAYSVYYVFDPDANPMGWGGIDEGGATLETMIEAIDYRTGKIRWVHPWQTGSRAGLMSTAGNLLFAGDGSNNVIALDATTGAILWHAGLGSSVSNGPISYELDGEQYVVVGAGETLWAFVMRSK